MEIFSKVVAFSENLNFTKDYTFLKADPVLFTFLSEY